MAQRGLTLDWTFKELRIEWRKLEQAKARSVRSGITKGLVFIRTRAKSSIRRRKRISKPGEPPSAHAKGLGIKSIFWVYNSFEMAGEVGPIKIAVDRRGAIATGTVPGVLEGGGTVTYPAKKVLTKGRSGTWELQKRKKRRVRIRPRPFMVPALEAEVAAGNVVGAFANTFTEN